MTKECTAISMVASVIGAPNFEDKDEVRYLDILDQRYIVRASHFGLVVADSFVEAERLFAIFVMEIP